MNDTFDHATIHLGEQSVPPVHGEAWVQVQFRKKGPLRDDPYIFLRAYDGQTVGVDLTPAEALQIAQALIQAALEVQSS